MAQVLMAYVETQRLAGTPDFVRWSASAAVVVMLHGLVAAALLSRSQESELETGAPVVMIELAPLSVAPPAAPSELAPGPQQIETESQERVREAPKPEPKQPEFRQTEDTPAPNPTVVLPPPVPETPKEPPEDKSAQEPRQAAPVPTAPPSVATSAPTAAAPPPGRVERPMTTTMVKWQRLLEAHLERHKRYPPAAQSRGEHGVASVAFTIDRQGRVLSARITRSSGSPILDGETLAMIRRAQPLPAPPSGLADEQLFFVVPIRYGSR